MLAGEVEPPGIFLCAPAVLKRQLTAFCFDCWIATGVSPAAIPKHIGDALNGIDSGAMGVFPYNFVSYATTHQTELLDKFITLFPGQLQEYDISILKTFFIGADTSFDSMAYSIVNGLSFLSKQRIGFRKRINTLGSKLRKLRDDPARDKTFEETEQQLQCERSALNALVKSINDRETYEWLTDEGLLPNYAFPESGVTLRSIIYRRKKETDQEGSPWQTWAYEFERPAVAAIRELAPENTFYAGHRKVEIDQVDLSLSDIEPWRFCNNCSFMRKVIGEEKDKSCPNCGSLMWADEGQKRNLVRLQQVFATSEDSSSRISDDSDAREPVFYNRQLLVNFDEKQITDAYRLDSADLPFGFEFIKKATLREVNFGRTGTGGDTVTIAGEEMERSGFVVCRSCGKIQRDHKPVEHAFSCQARNSDDQENLTDLLYLYREYNSEAIRILLPSTTFSKSDEILHSFIAALQLGLKLQFGGNVEHLQTCLHEEPIPDSTFRKRYLVLYDTVPGGTGYLQQLMISHEKMVEVLEKSLRVMENCSCRHDPTKDGCYRCLYAYRNSFDMRAISRAKAVELLSEIVSLRDKFVKTDNLKNIEVNSLFDSELEARFVEALRQSQRADRSVMLKKELVNRKPGYFLKVRDFPWLIEPQVDLNESNSVAIPVSVDFVFWPGRESTDTKPIAVFTDGFTYHKNRIGQDCAQRMAILESGKFDVWSFSWNDIITQTVSKNNWYEEYLPHRTTADEQTLMKYLDHFLGNEPGVDLEMRKIHQLNSFSWFINFLGNPNRKIWEKYAFVTALLYKKVGPSLSSDEEVASFISRLPITLAEQVVVDQVSNLIGFFSSTGSSGSSGHIELLMSIEKQAVNSALLEKLALIAYLDDTKPSVPGFESIWNGFLRVANLIQFLQGGVYLSNTGQTAGLYTPLGFIRGKHTAASSFGKVPDDNSWQEVFEYASSESTDVLNKARTLKKSPPKVGFELLGNNGQVIATAELAWETAKVALLLNDEDTSAVVFSEYGWKTAMLSDLNGSTALL
jgi:DEAD/DEAH box helicase domain-containing protein